jgi:hypothetical protein
MRACPQLRSDSARQRHEGRPFSLPVLSCATLAGVAAIRVAMVRTRRLAELRLFGMKHPLFVQRAITIVVQALSSLGSSRLVAICTSSLRSPPRTTGQ